MQHSDDDDLYHKAEVTFFAVLYKFLCVSYGDSKGEKTFRCSEVKEHLYLVESVIDAAFKAMNEKVFIVVLHAWSVSIRDAVAKSPEDQQLANAYLAAKFSNFVLKRYAAVNSMDQEGLMRIKSAVYRNDN